MGPLYLAIVIILFVAVITVIILQTYNKIIILGNKADEVKFRIDREIDKRYELAETFIQVIQNIVDANATNTIQTLVNRYKISEDSDSFKYYIDMTNVLNSIEQSLTAAGVVQYPLPEWYKTFHDNAAKVEELRIEYNEAALKINTALSAVPTNILGIIFKFKKRIIFPKI